MQAADRILNFIVATLKNLKETREINSNNIFNPIYSKLIIST